MTRTPENGASLTLDAPNYSRIASEGRTHPPLAHHGWGDSFDISVLLTYKSIFLIKNYFILTILMEVPNSKQDSLPNVKKYLHIFDVLY
jgi:hypothetical protein